MSSTALRALRRTLRHVASEACVDIWLAAAAGADDEYEIVAGAI